MTNDAHTIRTPIGKVRYLGSARSGTRAVWLMRVTSAALVPLTIGFVWLVLSVVGKDYKTARDMMSAPLAAIVMLLFVGASAWHMKLGMKVIIEDYVHDEHAKTWALIANDFFCYAIGLACIYATLRIGFV
jgi:succinate dehydrogenase / fumarate reductase, membrane anchor subunit